jgi:hypothetical protein
MRLTATSSVSLLVSQDYLEHDALDIMAYQADLLNEELLKHHMTFR